MRVIFFATIVTLLITMGCASDPMSSKDPKTFFAEGFSDKQCPFLLCSGRHNRLGTMLNMAIPNAGEEFRFGRLEHTSDGQVVRLWNYGRTGVYVIEKGKALRKLDTPPGAYLNRVGEVVLWYGENYSRGELHFPDGTLMPGPASFAVDPDGKYVCVGGLYRSGSEIGAAPITIRAVGEPEKILVTSKLEGSLKNALYANGRLYVCVWTDSDSNHGTQSCEIYREESGTLVLEDTFIFKSPLWGAVHGLISNVCPDGRHLLGEASIYFPPITREYILDIETRKYRRLRISSAWFLDPEVFDSAIDASAWDSITP